MIVVLSPVCQRQFESITGKRYEPALQAVKDYIAIISSEEDAIPPAHLKFLEVTQEHGSVVYRLCLVDNELERHG